MTDPPEPLEVASDRGRAGPGTVARVADAGDVAARMVAARRRAAAAIRTLIPIVAFADPPVAELDGAVADIEAAADRLAPFAVASRHHRSGGMRTISGDQPDVWEGHPIVGASSGLAAPLVIDEGADSIRATCTFSNAYEGAPGVIQGGFLASAFDYVLGRQAALTGLMVVTGTLTIRFRAGVPVDQEVALTSALVSVDGRKINVAGEARVGTTLCAEAEAIFISVGGEHYSYTPEDRADDR
ncbi:MAG: hypothetical protein JWN46_3283 [Acidimicrobiales bacterium]|nr:hypothetical protein [Acidimicrobiales bacterium]